MSPSASRSRRARHASPQRTTRRPISLTRSASRRCPQRKHTCRLRWLPQPRRLRQLLRHRQQHPRQRLRHNAPRSIARRPLTRASPARTVTRRSLRSRKPSMARPDTCAPHPPTKRPCATLGLTRATPSMSSSSDRPTSSRTRPASRSPITRAPTTTRCSSLAAWALAKRTCCKRSASRSFARTLASASSRSRAKAS